MNEVILKYLILGHQSVFDSFLGEMQRMALAEFIDSDKSSTSIHDQEMDKLTQALLILKKFPVPEQHSTEVHTAQELAEKIITLNQELLHTEETLRLVESELARIEPFGHIELDKLDKLREITGYSVQFFCQKHYKHAKNNEIPPSLVQISTHFDLDYFLSISKEPIYPEGFVSIEINRSTSDLKADHKRLDAHLHHLHHMLLEKAAFADFLKAAFAHRMNDLELQKAKNLADDHFDGSLFTLQAWMPLSRKDEFEQLCLCMPIIAEQVAPNEGEIPPVSLKNCGLAKVGQDLVDLYDTPSIQDKDPSVLVLFAFALFFAVIVADAGYGLIYLAFALFLKWKYRFLKGVKKRMITLFTCLAVSTTLWGVLTGAFFSIQLSPANPLQKFSIVHILAEKNAAYHLQNQDSVYHTIVKEYPQAQKAQTAHELFILTEHKGQYELMEDFHKGILAELAILIGLTHLIISFARNLYRFVGGLGWIAFLIGGYLFCPSVIGATSMVQFLGILDIEAARQTGLQLLGVGLAFAIVSSLIQHGLRGLEELFRSIQVFGDSLSYLRLYALGLASMNLAATFNSIGESVGFVYGAIIIFIGHSTNILLATMGGVIHGLRLNFLEWYHYCFDGGGRRFKPLKLLEHEL